MQTSNEKDVSFDSQPVVGETPHILNREVVQIDVHINDGYAGSIIIQGMGNGLAKWYFWKNECVVFCGMGHFESQHTCTYVFVLKKGAIFVSNGRQSLNVAPLSILDYDTVTLQRNRH